MPTLSSAARPAPQSSPPLSSTAPKRLSRTLPRFRPLLLAVSVVATVATGSWYGANLAQSSTSSQENKAYLPTASPTERISVLEARKMRLVVSKTGLESKISELQQRQRDTAEKVAARQKMRGESGSGVGERGVG